VLKEQHALLKKFLASLNKRMEIKHTYLLKIKNYAIKHVPNILQDKTKKIPWSNAL